MTSFNRAASPAIQRVIDPIEHTVRRWPIAAVALAAFVGGVLVFACALAGSK